MTFEAALFTVLDTDRQSNAAGSLGALGVTIIANAEAPDRQAAPYIVFQQVTGLDAYTKGRRVGEGFLFDVRAIDSPDTGQFDKTRAAAIAARIDTLLTDQEPSFPAITGRTLRNIRRESRIDLPVDDQGRRWQQVGGTYRVLLAT